MIGRTNANSNLVNVFINYTNGSFSNSLNKSITLEKGTYILMAASASYSTSHPTPTFELVSGNASFKALNTYNSNYNNFKLSDILYRVDVTEESVIKIQTTKSDTLNNYVAIKIGQ